MYLIRLDDASEYMDIEKWSKIEKILCKYKVKPIVGVIPNNKDSDFVNQYEKDEFFWEKVARWKQIGWEIALHGYDHVHITKDGGINPINYRSEFAGVELKKQKEKISKGIEIFKKNKIEPKIFFAPSHTFDINTLEALKSESDIRIISDTISNDIYKMNGFYFIPQQSGDVRNLPFKIITFCYHPNIMTEEQFNELEKFIKNNIDKFKSFEDLKFNEKKLSIYDKILRYLYFSIRRIRNKVRGK